MKPEQEKELKEKRGEIITHFAYIEDLIKKFISIHYFKTFHHPIMSEIFEDEYFSFGLLFRVFEKVVSKEKIEFPINKLRRLGQLRNVIAHASVHAKASGFSIEEISDFYFRHGGEDKKIEDVFSEYDSIKMDVQVTLTEIVKPSMNIEKLPRHKKDK